MLMADSAAINVHLQLNPRKPPPGHNTIIEFEISMVLLIAENTFQIFLKFSL